MFARTPPRDVFPFAEKLIFLVAEDAKLSNQKSRYTRKTCRWFLTRFMLAGIGSAPGWYADVITSFGWVTLWFSFPNARKLISSNKLTKLNCFRWTFCDGDDVIIASSFALMIRMGKCLCRHLVRLREIALSRLNGMIALHCPLNFESLLMQHFHYSFKWLSFVV